MSYRGPDYSDFPLQSGVVGDSATGCIDPLVATGHRTSSLISAHPSRGSALKFRDANRKLDIATLTGRGIIREDAKVNEGHSDW